MKIPCHCQEREKKTHFLTTLNGCLSSVSLLSLSSSVSAGLYGSENCALTEKDKNRTQGAEMRILRATLGVTRQDRLMKQLGEQLSR
jgi:hypothetical protein